MNMEFTDPQMLLEMHHQRRRELQAEMQRERKVSQTRIRARLLRQSLTLEITPARLQFEGA